MAASMCMQKLLPFCSAKQLQCTSKSMLQQGRLVHERLMQGHGTTEAERWSLHLGVGRSESRCVEGLECIKLGAEEVQCGIICRGAGR